jgi:serine/threonine-protein kinase
MEKMFGGRYEIEEKIGAGGMAIVYRAKDTLLNRTVAIKVLREQYASDEGFIRRFRREAQSAASLSHQNIVSIYDVGKDGNEDYIVMEYVKGQTLKDIIRTQAPLSQDKAIHIVRQIAEALVHAHANNIIHRDIKPQNILIAPDGRAKVTDFGIARAASSATVTHTGDIVGSVHYLSPEQAKGSQTTEQSDIYSLGIILYELIAGRLPYDGDTAITIALKHIQEEVELPGKLVAGVSPELETVIMKALAKSLQDRYKSAAEFLEDLDRIEAGETIVWEKRQARDHEDTMQTQVHRGLKDKVIPNEAKNDALLRTKKRRKKIPMLVMIAIAALIVVVGTSSGVWVFTHTQVVNVPDLTGKTVEEAKIELTNARLALGNRTETYSDEIKQGGIVSQSIKPKSEVKAGRSVDIEISKGVEYIKVPNVTTGYPLQENAESTLKEAGFTNITVKTMLSASVSKGHVFGQSVAPGSTWTKNGEIELFVSEGIQPTITAMPDFTGMSLEFTTDYLEKYDMKVMPIMEESDLFPEKAVITTEPKPGKPIQQGSEVTIVVSQGPGPPA